jgi:hypothetical protein
MAGDDGSARRRRREKEEGDDSMSTSMSTALVRSSALCAALVAASAWAEVDVEIRNGDKVTGTLSPATEIETLRMRVPKDAVITLKGAAGKKGPKIRMVLKDPSGAEIAHAEGKSASIAKQTAAVSGLYSVEITSLDGKTDGDYSFAATWKSRTLYGGNRPLAANVDDVVEFSADAGATATFAVKKAKKSAAEPALKTLTFPDYSVDPLSGTTQKRALNQTGDFALAVSSAVAGDVTTTVKIKPPKASARKYALTKAALGEGGTAFSTIVGPEGGPIQFPEVPSGEPGAELVGSGVVVPPGALPVGTSIVIGTAPDIPVDANQTGAGTTVEFGPDGLVFGTKNNPKTATVTIPFDPAFVGMQETLTIYTRNTKGVVSPVPKPYDFDDVHNTVSFATGHFSSFRVVSSLPSPTSGNFLTVANVADPEDVCIAYDQSPGATPAQTLFYVAEGDGKTVGAIRTGSGTTAFVHETWVGGGTQTTLPAGRTQFQFVDKVNTVYATTDGTLYVGTTTQVFSVDPLTGTVTLLAGSGAVGDSGDNGPSKQAKFTNIRNILAFENGNFYIADDGAHRIRYFTDFLVQPWAGNGTFGVGADGGSVATTAFVGPADMAFATNGALYVADGARIRRIDPVAAVNVTVAGAADGSSGSTGDGGAPSAALFERIDGLSQNIDTAHPTDDEVVVVDGIDHTLRVLDFTAGAVSLVAGAHGTPGFNGDIGSTPGRLRNPTSVVSIAGILCIADKGNGRVRLIIPGQ